MTRKEILENLKKLNKTELRALCGTRRIIDGVSKIAPIQKPEDLQTKIVLDIEPEPQQSDKDFPKNLKKIKEITLSFGGSDFCNPWGCEDDAHNILKYGQLWLGNNARFKKGAPSQCHMNTSRLWRANEEQTRICTGYALSADGIWRQHSWVIQVKARSNIIWETTTKRIAYFGFVLDQKEANTFYYDNN